MVQCEVIVANASFGHAQLSVARPHTCVNRGSRWAGALPPANQTQNRPPPPPPAAWQVEAAGGIIGAISARRGQNFAASGGAPQGRRGQEHAASTDCSTSAQRAPPPPCRLATCRAACCGASARHLSSSEPLRSQNFRRLRRGASGRRGQALQSRMRPQHRTCGTRRSCAAKSKPPWLLPKRNEAASASAAAAAGPRARAETCIPHVRGFHISECGAGEHAVIAAAEAAAAGGGRRRRTRHGRSLPGRERRRSRRAAVCCGRHAGAVTHGRGPSR